MIKISILIPIHNRIEVTKEGLQALTYGLQLNKKKGNLCHYEIVIIDDGSVDGSSEWIEENYPEVHILKGNGNLWWSGAINLGARFSIETLKVDFLLLWNNDIVPRDDYFIQIDAMLSHNPDFFNKHILGSAIYFHNEPKKLLCTGGFLNKFSGTIPLSMNVTGDEQNNVKCDWLWGMGTIVAVSLINDKKIWWDEKRFPQYFGDADFTLRYKRKGIKILTSLNLVIYNKTEHTGITKVYNFRDFWQILTAERSFYNLYRNLLFHSIHGIPPLSYIAMFTKYGKHAWAILKKF